MTPALGYRTLAGPSGPLAVTVSGPLTDPLDGSVAVLVHPINTAAVVWDAVLPLLSGPAVAPDLRGHGGSGQHGPFTVEQGYLPDLLAVLDGLGLGAVHLAGGSLGGPISLALAALHPSRVRSVTTFGATLGTGVPAAAIEAMVAELDAAGTERYFAELVPRIVGPAYRDDARLLATMRTAAGRRPEAVVAAVLRGAFGADIRHLAGRVRVPVLAVGGTEDPTCPPSMTEEIAAATGGASVILDGVGHLPMLEVPERVAELINRHTGGQGR